MTVESQSLKVFIRLQDSSTEYLDVAVASARQPESVRDALLKALRRVPLRSIDLSLLRIEHELLAAFKSPWKKPNKLQLVLESCRQGNVTERTERLFYEHGGDSAIAILGIATRLDVGLRTKYDGRWLLREIDALSDGEKIELVRNIQDSIQESVRTDVDAILQSFTRSPLERPVPPVNFPRPRNRKANDIQCVTTAESPPPPSLPLTNHQYNTRDACRTNEATERAADSPPPSSSFNATADIPSANQHHKRRRLTGGSADHMQKRPRITVPHLDGDAISSSSLPQSPSTCEQDQDLSGWNLTGEEITQLIINAGGIDEYNWDLPQEEITQLIMNARAIDKHTWELQPEPVIAVVGTAQPRGVESPGANL